ncbi:gliding motility-associated C-terminal domain-containing protein [Mucilaginibacter lutimaris]|uniref:Gliding motility-associated C-terminal domain-containing protein n=1 Tax=Mucilaginibacter lutimaris TaxID=931629 RepID=A0ABW2ZKJ2_9SPHI
MNSVKAFCVLLTSLLVCCSVLGFAQNTTSQGKEFWTAYMSHQEDAGPSKMALYITSDEATTVKVEIADNSFPAIEQDVNPHQITIIEVPKVAFLKSAGQYLQGIHITSPKNIAVFAHIYANAVSGATLLLPVSVLGKNYFSINYTQKSNAPSSSAFMIVATEDETTVEINSPVFIRGLGRPNVAHTIKLKKGEVYQALSTDDLTNTKIRSVSSVNGVCKKIAVFSGSTKIGIGCDAVPSVQFSSDNLFQQVYPTTSWGKQYITVPLKNRNYDIFRVFLSEPNTTITVNGSVVPPAEIKSNNVYEFSSNATNVISANKPIQVVQYAVTQGRTMNSCELNQFDVGDPEMIYLNPLEQTLNHVTLYSADAYKITRNYINVVIKADKAATFKLDGITYGDFAIIPNSNGYAYAQIEVGAGTHYISADDGFNAIAYGFGDHESYGYSAGANLKNLNEYISFIDPATNTSQLNGCAGIPYKLQLVLPYQTTQIKWDFKDGTAVQTFDSPVGIPFQKDGVTLYRYDYPGNKLYTKGRYSYTATVINPLADECGTSKDVDFDFGIADFAQAAFSISGNLCSATEITLHDESVADPGSITKIKVWWDYVNHPDIYEVYNSGDLAADNNYHHTYDYSATSTFYTVKMVVYTGEGGLCDNGVEHQVEIKGSPMVTMGTIAPMCIDAGKIQIVVNSHGFAGTGRFSGPGVNPITGLFDPVASGAGKFTIAYRFVAPNGCDALVTQDIVVNPLPTADIGDINLLEGESVVLKPRVSGTGLTYQWVPSTGLDNPNTLNPMCSATEDVTYRLTVTTAAGCSVYDDVFVNVLKKPIVVNAFTPNGDGINDTWGIKYLDTYPGNTVDIYNRQGEKVYSSVGYATPWDGRYRGNVLPTGTYYYIINPKNGRKVISGSVTILK